MTQIQTFYGKLGEVENKVNKFLAEKAELVQEVLQSIDIDPETTGTYVLFTILYEEKKVV